MGKRTPQEEMHEFLTGYSRASALMRRVFRRVPSGPNCKICAAPFAGPGGAVLRHVGFGRFAGNPTICNFCIKDLQRMGVQGAEIPVSLLFADIRGSTGIGERLSPTDFRAFLNRFYRIASEAVLASDGIVDKFVGDEVIGLFFGGISGDHHAAAAVAAGTEPALASRARGMRHRPARSPSAPPCTPAWPSWARRRPMTSSATSPRSETWSTRRRVSPARQPAASSSSRSRLPRRPGPTRPTSSVAPSRSAAAPNPWRSSPCGSQREPVE